MLDIATFVMNLTNMLGRAFRHLSHVRLEQRQRQSEYLDSVSERLAAAAVAVQEDQDLTKHLAELRFHLGTINEVLRLGDPAYLMTMSDDTVQVLQERLDEAIKCTKPSIIKPAQGSINSETYVAREELKNAFLNASGVFRGAAVALKASDKGLKINE